MIILAVDTNSPYGSVAIIKDCDLLAEINLISPADHSERLLPAIDFLLERLDLQIRDLSGFALAVGPGSFTGIRIGMSTVKALASACGLPIAPVSNLEALAVKCRGGFSRLLCPLLDAKKGEVYAGLFESKNQDLQEVIPQGVYAPDEFFSLLPAHRVISFIGTGVPVYKDKLLNYCKDKARFSRRSLFTGREIGILGHRRLNSDGGLDHHQVEPLYFRRSQAEENNR